MTIDAKVIGEKLQYVLSERHQKYQHYHLEKSINRNIVQILPPDQRTVIEQDKFTYSPCIRS